MTSYLIRRFLQLIVVLWFSSMAVFSLLYFSPGGPLTELIHEQRRTPISSEDIARLSRQYDLDLPVWQAYTRWVIGLPEVPGHAQRLGLIRGDFGESWRIQPGAPNLQLILDRLPNTLKLTLSATLLSLLVAIPIGVISAVKQYSKLDYFVTTGSFFGISMPVFWFGLLMIILFGYYAKTSGFFYLPTGNVTAIRPYVEPGLGRVEPGGLLDQVLHLVMPVLVLSLAFMATWSRFTRSGMLEVLKQDYVRTARAKGLRERLVIMKHALRNALIPLITVVSFQIPGLFAGAILTETVFNWSGMGTLYIQALGDADWPLALAFLMILSLLVVIANLLADILFTIVDPRIRFA